MTKIICALVLLTVGHEFVLADNPPQYACDPGAIGAVGPCSDSKGELAGTDVAHCLSRCVCTGSREATAQAYADAVNCIEPFSLSAFSSTNDSSGEAHANSQGNYFAGSGYYFEQAFCTGSLFHSGGWNIPC